VDYFKVYMFQRSLSPRKYTKEQTGAEKLFLQLELKRVYSEQKLEIGVAAEQKLETSFFLYRVIKKSLCT
jgi:hypothetical protein